MKKEILDYLKYDRSYKTGVALYHKYGTKLSVKKQLNVQPESTHMMGILLEEFRELTDIPRNEFQRMINKPVEKLKKVAASTPEEKFKVIFGKAQEAFQKGDLVLTMKLLEESTSAAVSLGETPTELISLKEEANYNNDIKKVPEGFKMTLKLRDEFPFLKSPDCPVALKILVQDKLTAFDAYKAAHEALFTAENEKELLESAKDTVENYLMNRQIWDELNHYKETGEILGIHPVFTELNLQKEIDEMTPGDLAQEIQNVKSNISKTKKSIKDKKNDPKQKEWNEKLELLYKKQAMIEKRLGITDKKKK